MKLKYIYFFKLKTYPKKSFFFEELRVRCNKTHLLHEVNLQNTTKLPFR